MYDHYNTRYLLVLLIPFIIPYVISVHLDEAGIVDFHIPTTGHSHLTRAYFTPTSLISSGNNNCYFASRSISNGDINWRRNGCGSAGSSSASVLKSGNKVYTLDTDGVFRVWNEDSGGIEEDVMLGERGELLEIYGDVVVKSVDKVVWVEGQDTIYAREMLKGVKRGVRDDVSVTEQILDLDTGYMVAGWVSGMETSGSQLALVKMKGKSVEKLKHLKNPSPNVSIVAQSVRVWGEQGGVVAITSTGMLATWTESNGHAGILSSVDSLGLEGWDLKRVEAKGAFLELWGLKENQSLVALFRSDIANNGQLTQIPLAHKNQPPTAVATCRSSTSTTIFTTHKFKNGYLLSTSILSRQSILPSASSSIALPLTPTLHGEITHLIPDCFTSHVVVSTSSSTTHLHPNWTDEESLSSVSQMLFFDYSTHKDTKHNKLFGFHKLATLLSSTGRLFGMDTVSLQKGKILYSLLLPIHAHRHLMVHGGISSASGVHGAFSSQKKSPIVLILSFFNDKVEGRCVNAITGELLSEYSEAIPHPILNIIPIQGQGEAHACAQMAMLIYETGANNFDYQIIPAATPTELRKMTDQSKHGFFVHAVSKATGEVKSFQLTDDRQMTDKPHLELVGQLTFPPSVETITSVHYPPRGEVIQSPTTILGDDSLLLKYLNPHVAVVVTEVTPEYLSDLEKEPSLLSTPTASKKPQGVSANPNPEPPPPPSPPTLFVNIIDTATSKILYRASHAHKTPGNASAAAGPSHVPLAISENWIIYSYFNHKTKRTDIAVLTLFEGMIDKHSLSLFKSPDQEPSFSTFSSPKPIVLQKTYAHAKSIQGLAVTRTARGISTKNVLIATPDGIATIDARFLDPRRPSGELKQSEKREGLIKYHPILPLFPQSVVSYTKHVEGCKIATVSTNVESQSLVLLYGGNDLFFTRVAPSKGFDLLPESFNKGLLGVVVVALLVGYAMLKRVCNDKLVKVGWA